MGTRNFGLGSRDMAWAGKIALKTQSGLSFSGIATVSERWGQFCAWAESQGIKKMESVTKETLVRYGTGLADKVRLGELSAATAQNYVSAASRVMEIARGDRLVSVSPTRDCGIPQRSGIATESRVIDENDHQATQGSLPLQWQPSPNFRRVGFRIASFEACSAFTRVTACILAKPLTWPSTSEASDASLPPRLLRLLPAGAKVAGRDSHPLKGRAFGRRTTISYANG